MEWVHYKKTIETKYNLLGTQVLNHQQHAFRGDLGTYLFLRVQILTVINQNIQYLLRKITEFVGNSK